MSTHQRPQIALPALLLIVVGQPASIAQAQFRGMAMLAVEGPRRTDQPTGAAASDADQTPQAPTLAFNFKDTPWELVLDFLARQTNMPVIREADAPKSAVTFLSSERYALPEALEIVNRLLWMHGLQVRRQENYLLLSKLDDMRALSRVVEADAAIAGEGGEAEIVTVVVPLNNAAAAPLAEQLKPMVSRYGGVTALPQQNALILVDTAAQCRRLRSVIEALDAEAPSDARYEVFPLQHSEAPTVLAALTGLISERRSLVIVDKDGNQKTVRDDKVEGLSIAADDRTNSIIAVGPEGRLKTVGELVKLLDRPSPGAAESPGAIELATFTFSTARVEDAAAAIERLFSKLPEPARPVVVPMPTQSRLTMSGKSVQVEQAALVLADLDPGVVRTAAGELAPASSGRPSAEPPTSPVRAIIQPLRNVRADAAAGVISRLLSPRQQSVLRFSPLPDGRAYVVTGPSTDVDAFRALVAAIDVQASGPTVVRQVRLASADPRAVLDRAIDLYRKTTQSQTDPIESDFDATSRSATLIGSGPAVEAVSVLLREAEQTAVVSRETRTFPLAASARRASEVAERARTLAAALLTPGDGSPYEPPQIDGASELSALIVRAKPEQFAVIERLVGSLDAAMSRPGEFAVVTCRGTDADSLADTIFMSWPASLPRPSVTPDPASGSLWVSGEPEAIARFTRAADAIRRSAAKPVLRVIELRNTLAPATAAAVSQAITGLGMNSGSGPGESGGVGAKAVAAEASNAVLITALEDDADVLEELTRSLDVQGRAPDTVSVATVPLRHARAELLAPVVQSLFAGAGGLPVAAPQPAGRAGRIQPAAAGSPPPPVRVVAERRLNALVMTGPSETLEAARALIAELDAAPDQPAGSAARQPVVRLIPLKSADAATAAETIAGVFADEAGIQSPPVVRADPASNALLVRAAPDQLERLSALVAQLDAAAALSTRDLRRIPVDRSRITAAALAQTLQRLLEADRATPPAGPTGEVPAANAPPRPRIRIVTLDELIGQEPQPSAEKDGAVPDKEPGACFPAPHPLHAALAVVHAAVIQSALEPVAAPVDRPADTPDELFIAVDAANNALVISGPSREADRIAALIAQIEQTLPREPATLHVIPLSDGADAWGMYTVLNALAAQLGQASPENPSGLTGKLTVIPEWGVAGGNPSLIIAANDTDFQTISAIIGAVARPGAGPTLTVKTYPLANLSAEAARRAIADLFSPSPRGRQSQRVLNLEVAEVGSPASAPAPAAIDPASVRVTNHPGGRAVIVAAPVTALPLIDRLLSLLDQSALADKPAARIFTLRHASADRAAAAAQGVLDAARTPGSSASARVIADERTNAVLVTAPADLQAEAQRVLEALDQPAPHDGYEVAFVPLKSARASAAARVLQDVLARSEPGAPSGLLVSAVDESSILILRGEQEVLEEARAIITELEKGDAGAFPVRTIAIKRADAASVAAALQRFFDERARLAPRPGGRSGRQVALIADKRTGTLLVCAADGDFSIVESLVRTLDAPASTRSLAFRIIPLRHASVDDIKDLVRSIISQARPSDRADGEAPRPSDLSVEFDPRTESVILLGHAADAQPPVPQAGPDAPPGATPEALSDAPFDVVERIVRTLDAPRSSEAAIAVRSIKLRHAEPWAVARAVNTAMRGERRSAAPSRDRDALAPDQVRVETDYSTRGVMLVGRQDRLELAAAMVKQLDDAAGADSAAIVETIQVRFADADRIAQSLQRFFSARAYAASRWDDFGVSILGSPDGNVLIVSAGKDDLALVRQFVAQMDQPDDDDGPGGKGGRARELIRLKNADAAEIAATLREQFPRQPGSGGLGGAVVVTPQPAVNAIIVSAPRELLDNVQALIDQLDAPPTLEDSRIVTVTLVQSRAEEVAQAIRAALPQAVKVTITPVRRTNSLLLTGSAEAVALALDQVKALDEQAPKAAGEIRRIRLKHAGAYEAAAALRQLVSRRQLAPGETPPAISVLDDDNALLISAAPDQLVEIASILEQLDVPADGERMTEFVPLAFADAEATASALRVFYGRLAAEASGPEARKVTIIANPAAKSLVISAAKGEWPGIRALLAQLDNEQYDTSRRLDILPLEHADADSLARTLNETFAAPLRAELERVRARQAAQPQTRRNTADGFFEPPVPAVLVDTLETISVAAEPLTNALVVSASRENVERIKALVARLDVPEVSRLPDARIIPVSAGPATAVAASLRQLFSESPAGRGGPVPARGARSVVIIGDDRAGALIVRADEAQFAQVRALAEALQQQGDRSRLTVRVIRLKTIPAARLLPGVRATFGPVAQQSGESLSVELDRTANALVIASSEHLFEQVRRLAEELDGAQTGEPGPDAPAGAPSIHQSVHVIDVEHLTPDSLRQQLEQMGLTRPQPGDRPGVVAEPIIIIPLTTRRAVAIVAGPQDAEAVRAVVKTLDTAPGDGEAVQHAALIRLTKARAEAVALSIEAMLRPKDQDSQVAVAAALAEQVRRLSIHRDGADQPDLAVDLARPIRIVPEPQTNALIIASTRDNVAALTQLAELLDRLPIADAVVLRFFTLQSASAQRVAGVVRELFQQGDRLRTLADANLRGEPSTEVGRALGGRVAVSVDDRTNALLVAGSEESVALVELMVKQLDSDRTASWIEPAVIRLQHADPVRLAATLRQMIVDGLGAPSPEQEALQRQVARLRVALRAEPPPARESTPAEPAAPRPTGIGGIEADRFAPLSTLVIIPDANLRALIVVGSRANTLAVSELAKMLDVPAAAAENSVRVFPLELASADRVAGILRDLFRGQIASGALQPQDDLIVSPDARTNALVISTSPRSFLIVESLIRKLDSDTPSPAVGLTIIPVPSGDVTDLAPRVERLLRERIESARRAGGIASPGDAVSIQPDPATRSLIVAASRENIEIIRGLVRALTEGGEALAAEQTIDVIAVTSARVEDLAAAVQSLYVEKQNRERGPDAVRVSADPRLNALVVRGRASDVQAVRALAERLDASPIAAVTEIRRIELARTDAADVVRLLQNVLAGRPIAGGGTVGARKAQVLRFLRDQEAGALAGKSDTPPTEAEISGAIQEQVTLTAELRTNSVVVVAPSRLMVLIEALIADLDATSAGGRTVRIFRLTNADARAMAEVLRDLFNLRQQGSTLVLVPGRTDGPVSAQPLSDGPQALSAGSLSGAGSLEDLYPTFDERQQLAITIDPRTNSLLVSGTPEYLERVAEVVVELDAIQAEDREQVVYELRNAKAADVATTIRDYFRDQVDKARQLLGAERSGSILRLLEREITVQGDAASNRLIVGVSPRYRELVASLVNELDSTPPQVMIQVLLAEVTIDQQSQWGVDARVGPFGGDDYRVGALAAGAGVSTALGVPNVSVSSNDFELLIRALESQGRLEVLSRPQVLVNNNEEARIQVGENIAIVDGVERLDNGNSVADVRREDVGIILRVQPAISSDGFVRMDIVPEITSVSARTTEISEDFQAPIITKRQVETNVTIRDGETVVIGGLIQTLDEEVRTKIPLLGDIPVAGDIFKSTDIRRQKTELLVILTPRVVRSGTADSAGQLRDLSERELRLLSQPERLDYLLKPDLLAPQPVATPDELPVPDAAPPSPEDPLIP